MQYGSYRGAPGTSNTNRYPSPAIFSALDALAERPGRTVGIFDDFETFPKTWGTTEGNWGRYKTFGSSGSASSDGDAVGGVMTLTEATDNESMALMTGATPFQIINTGGLLGFEARIKVSSIADTSHGLIVGLADARTLIVGDPLDTSSVLISTLNFVGWQKLETDGDRMNFTFQENGETQVVVEEDAATLVADTFIKVGFLFDPAKKLLTHFVDGLASSTTKTVSDTAGDAFPNDVRLGMVLARMSGASTPGTQSIDWWKCVQHIPA